MKKIVFFNSTMQAGGPARVINLWSNFFVNRGYDVEVVSNINVSLFYDFDHRVKYSILGIDKFRQTNKIKTLLRIFNFLKKRKSEVLIFSKGLYIPYLFFLKYFGLIDKSLKLVYVIHGGTSDFKILYNNLAHYMINKTFDNIIVNYDDYNNYSKPISKSLKRKIVDLVFDNAVDRLKKKITYMTNPVTFKTKETPTYEEKIVLAIGRLDYVKGFDLLIQGWGQIYHKYPDWKLRIVGSGDQKEFLEKCIEELSLNNCVEMLPTSSDIMSLMLNSSIYAMSSREEGLPMVVIEAMECALPIVAFKNIGASYLINNKENGLLCEIGDIDGLAANLELLILDKNLRIMLGSKSKEMVSQYYIENLVSAWNDILYEGDRS